MFVFFVLKELSNFRYELEGFLIGLPFLIMSVMWSGYWGYRIADTLKSRHFNPGELDRLQSLAEADRPEMSSDSLVYRFNKKIGLGKTGAVYVDQAGRMLHFFNCHLARGFWTLTASRWFSCAFDELRAVTAFKAPYVQRGAGSSYRVNRGSESLTVVTVGGKAKIPGTSTGYEEMRDIIKKLKPVADEDASTEHPATFFALLWGSIVGGIGGLIVAQPTVSTSDGDLFWGSLWIGAAVGIASSLLLIWFAGRFLKINLAVPMMLSLIAGGSVLMLGVSFDPLVAVILAFLATIAGGVLGLYGQFTKKKDVESKQDKRKSDHRTL